MRTFFSKQAAWEWLRYGLIATVLVCLSANFTSAQSFLKLYGDTDDNYLYDHKVYGNHIYAIGLRGFGDDRQAIFVKMDKNTGTIVWQASLSQGTYLATFTTNGRGEFMLVGRTTPSRLGVDNRSIIWKVTDLGNSYSTDCVRYHRQGQREGFQRIKYRSTMDDYLVQTITTTNGSFDNIYLMTVKPDCGLVTRLSYNGGFDHQFSFNLIPDLNDQWTMLGNNGSNGRAVYVSTKSDLSFLEAYDLNFALGNGDGGNGGSSLYDGLVHERDKLMVGNNINRSFLIQIGAGGALRWCLNIPESSRLQRIVKGERSATGQIYYILGRSVVDGLERLVLYKFDHPGGSAIPTLVWTKYLDQGETEYSGGYLHFDDVTSTLIYSDLRKDNPSTFGNFDALLGRFNTDFSSCITKKVEHTIKELEVSLVAKEISVRDAQLPDFVVADQGETPRLESVEPCPNVCEGNYFQNGNFEQVTGNPSASVHQDIDLAVGWSSMWSGGSLADLNDGGTAPIASMTVPPNIGVYASFWILNDAVTTRNATYREGMYNRLNTTIPQNSCSYDLSFKIANSMSISTANSQTYEIAIYGVYNPGGGSAITPTGMFTPRDLDLWGAASGNITLLGTVTVPVGIDQNWQMANLTFNATNAPASGITHIMITRGETLVPNVKQMYMYFDDFCLQKKPCEPSTDLNCDLVDYNYTGSNGQLRYSFSVPNGTPLGNWTATGGAYGGNTVGIGSGLNINYTFPSAGTYTICYNYLDEQGCEHICCKTICITGDPYNCNLIQQSFDAATNTWILTATGASASDVDYWQNDITFQQFGQAAISVSVPNPVTGQFGFYSVKVFDPACDGYRICCIRVPHEARNECGLVNESVINCGSNAGIYNLSFNILNTSGRTGLTAEISLLAPFGIGYQGCGANVGTITGVGTSQTVNLNIEECFASLSTGTTVRYKVTLRDPNSDWCCHFEEETITIPNCDACPSTCPSDPLISVPWLAPFITNKAIYQCKLDGICVYKIADCATADDLTTLYDCNGQIICQEGGIGGNICSEIARLTDCIQYGFCPNSGCLGTPDPDIFCTTEYDPVCGCDGNTYGNSCEALRAGILSTTPGVCGGSSCNGPNLVRNGDFEGGNWAFTSSLPQQCYCSTASYCIQANARNKCNNSIWKNITSSGKYMIIDGANNGSFSVIWEQNNINVTTGTTYEFGFDHHPNVSGGDAPTLIVQINGVTVASNLKGIKDIWNTFTDTWTASSNGTINMKIVQTQAGTQYNDYGIDNIVFKDCSSNLSDEVEGRSIQVADAITLSNAPNPFRNSTTITFTLPTEMEANISVFDTKGRIVFTQSGTFQTGENRVELDASHNLTSGLYYYRLETAEQVLTKSMLMLQE